MSSKDKDASEELDTLFNEQTLNIGHRDVTVREFSFIEGLKASPIIMPLIDALATALRQSDAGDLGLSVLEQVFSDHIDLLNKLMLICSDIDSLEFINGLNDEDGQLLLLTFWTVNRSFFIRRLQRRSLEKSPLLERLARPS